MSTPEETSAQQEERLQRILQEVEQRLRRSLPNPFQPLEKTEQEVFDVGEDIKRIIEKETLAQTTEKQESLARSVRCSCGQIARYVASRSRQLVTRNGVYTFWRAYYHCRSCQQGFCPLDALLALGTEQFSVGVRSLIARFSSFLPFATAARELEVVCGICLSANTVRRHSQTIGQRIRRDWEEKEQRLWQSPEPVSPKRPSHLHLTMDGVMILVGSEWKEVKVACAYQREGEGRVKEAAYYATLANSQAFGKRVRTLGHERGAENCSTLSVVADGADWIWQETGKYYPTRVQIVDYYHAVQHLWQVATARFGKDVATQSWIDKQQARLLADEVSLVIADIEEWSAQSKEQQEVRRQVSSYLRTHAHRMRYKTFRDKGYHIGSGVAEASCKAVVQARFKGVGMRWSQKGAEAMLHLRATWCNKEFTDFRDIAKRI